MAETSTPWNSPQDFYEGEWRQYFSGAFSEGGIVNDYTGNAFSVNASGASTQVTVTAGQFILCGMLFTLTASKTLDLASFGTAPLSAQTRVDFVLLRYTFSTRTITVTVRAGTPASSNTTATAPVLTRDPNGVWEQEIARITRTGNVAVTQAMVRRERRWLSPVGYVPGTAVYPADVPIGAVLLERDDIRLHLLNDDGDPAWESILNPAWIRFPLSASISHADPPLSFRKRGSLVDLFGTIVRSSGVPYTSSAGKQYIGRLPDDYRPKWTSFVPCTMPGDTLSVPSVVQINGIDVAGPEEAGKCYLQVPDRSGYDGSMIHGSFRLV